MRHRSKVQKLQRSKPHRESLLRNLASSLIEHRQITTTLGKAKALKPFADKLVTLGKKGDLHSRRRALSLLGSNNLAQRSTKALFEDIAPKSANRQGGYTRIIKLGQRASDSAPMALIEWVDAVVTVEEEEV